MKESYCYSKQSATEDVLKELHIFEYWFPIKGTQFTPWLESEGAYSDIDLFRDLLQRAQFQSNLDSELCFWLIDQKPKLCLRLLGWQTSKSR